MDFWNWDSLYFWTTVAYIYLEVNLEWIEVKLKVKYKSWMNIQMNEPHGIDIHDM
jgi:hypothetical protein